MSRLHDTLARTAPLAILAALVLVLHLAGVPAEALASFLAVVPSLR